MKKLIGLILLTITLTACSQGKWNQPNEALPEETRIKMEEEIDAAFINLEEEPESVTDLFLIAHHYDILGDYRKAEEYYKKVLELEATNWASLNNLANLYEDLEEYEDAAVYIKKLYELDQTSIEVIKDTVRILLKAGDAASAEQALQNFESKMISEDNPNADLQELVDSLYQDIEEWKESNLEA